ncbi:MAG: hypothetical protein AAB925_01785 [Patescibacteria group bacterium]
MGEIPREPEEEIASLQEKYKDLNFMDMAQSLPSIFKKINEETKNPKEQEKRRKEVIDEMNRKMMEEQQETRRKLQERKKESDKKIKGHLKKAKENFDATDEFRKML